MNINELFDVLFCPKWQNFFFQGMCPLLSPAVIYHLLQSQLHSLGHNTIFLCHSKSHCIFLLIGAIKYPSDSCSCQSSTPCPLNLEMIHDFWCLLGIRHSACQSANLNMDLLLKTWHSKWHLFNWTEQKQWKIILKESKAKLWWKLISGKSQHFPELMFTVKQLPCFRAFFLSLRMESHMQSICGAFFFNGSENQLRDRLIRSYTEAFYCLHIISANN